VGAQPNKLKLTGHRALQISVLPFGHEIKRFQLPGHQGRQLSREPLGGAIGSVQSLDSDVIGIRRMFGSTN